MSKTFSITKHIPAKINPIFAYQQVAYPNLHPVRHHGRTYAPGEVACRDVRATRSKDGKRFKLVMTWVEIPHQRPMPITGYVITSPATPTRPFNVYTPITA